MADEEITGRLDRIISLLRLAHSDAIERARESILKDDVNAKLLDMTADAFVSAGELKKKVGTATKQSEKTVQRRIQELVALGVLERRATGTAAYRATGLL